MDFWEQGDDAYSLAWGELGKVLAPAMIAERSKHSRMSDWWDETIGEPMWSKQREIMDAVDDNRFVSVASCHGAGKSEVAARIAVSYLHTRPHSIVLTTAPTGSQVRNVLWRYIRRIHSQNQKFLLGRALQQELQIEPDWYGLGFKPADQETDRFQGFHAPYLLVIIDEAAGVPDGSIDVLHATMTSRHARFLMIGNPTSLDGRFRESFHERRDLYHTIKIPATETPNFTGESDHPGMDILKDALVTPEFVREEIAIHGADSDYVRSRIRAEFPLGTIDTLISLRDIEICENMKGELGPFEEGGFYAGLDVARFGDDETALCIRRGPYEFFFEAWQKADTMQTAEQVHRVMCELDRKPRLRGIQQNVEIRVDEIGIGAGVVDRLKQFGYKVKPVNVGGASSDKTQFQNLRQELWWQHGERYKNHLLAPLADGGFDNKMKSQLSNVMYDYPSGWSYLKPRIEPKDKMKQRTKGSPDRAEAQMLAYAVLPRIIRSSGVVAFGKARGEW